MTIIVPDKAVVQEKNDYTKFSVEAIYIIASVLHDEEWAIVDGKPKEM